MQAVGLTADLDRLLERRGRQLGEWLSLVRDEADVGVAQFGELFGKGPATIERQHDLLVGAERFAQAIRDRQEPVGQVIVRRDRHTKHRQPILVMNVVVARARDDAPILHPPSLSNDVLAGIWPQVVVDVKHRVAFVVCRVRDQPFGHARLEHRATIGLIEQTIEQLAYAAGRRHALRAQQRRTSRCRNATYAFDDALADRERTDHRVEGNPKPIGMASLERALRLLVQSHLAGQREQDPASSMLHELAASYGLRGHRHDVSGVLVGRDRIVAEVGVAISRSQRQGELPSDVERERCDVRRRRRSWLLHHAFTSPVVPHTPHGRVDESLFARLFAMHVDRHSLRVEHRVPGSSQIWRYLRDLAASRTDHCAEAISLLLATESSQIFLPDAQCSRESAEVKLSGLRECHGEYVARSAIVVVELERIDEGAPDVHARDPVLDEHHAIRRETARLVSTLRRWFRQRQVESFHTHETTSTPSGFPPSIDPIEISQLSVIRSLHEPASRTLGHTTRAKPRSTMPQSSNRPKLASTCRGKPKP